MDMRTYCGAVALHAEVGHDELACYPLILNGPEVSYNQSTRLFWIWGREYDIQRRIFHEWRIGEHSLQLGNRRLECELFI